MIFLSNGEFETAVSKFSKFSQKFKFLPFSIDTDFGFQQDTLDRVHSFFGNDGNREYKKVVELVNEMKDYSFLLVTSR